MFEKTFEKILNKKENVYFNDGSSGFINRVLNPLNAISSATGFFEKIIQHFKRFIEY